MNNLKGAVFIFSGGVYTTAAAFGRSNIYDRLREFGVTFQIVTNVDDDNMASKL
jgi:hypothetical protein